MQVLRPLADPARTVASAATRRTGAAARAGLSAAWLIAALAGPAAVQAATTSQTINFNFNHGGAVDSGLISVLGTFTTTTNTAAPSMSFARFDPALGTLTAVDVTVTTTSSPFVVAPSGLLSLVSSASVTRTLSYSLVAGTATASGTNTLTTSGGTLLTLLGLGSADIGGAPLTKSASFTAAGDLTQFTGPGAAVVGLTSTDALTASTLVSLVNGAGFRGTGSYAGNVRITYTFTPNTPVSGRVFVDNGQGGGTANDGVANGGEIGFAGRPMRLLDAGNTVIDRTVTAADGSFRLLVPPTVANGTALRVVGVDDGAAIATGGSPGTTGGAYARAANTVSWTHAGSTGHTGVTFAAVPVPSFTGEAEQTTWPGTVVFYRHRYIATTRGQVAFTATHLSTPPIAGWTETVYVDANDNGLIDTAETPVAPAVSVTAGQVVPLIVRVAVPETAPFNVRVRGTLRADLTHTQASPALASSAVVHETTEVTEEDSGTVVLNKVASRTTAAPGMNIVYAVTFTNNGVEPITNVVVRDITPAHTTFVSAANAALPASLGTPVTVTPLPGDTGPLKWTFPGPLSAGASGTVTFTVRVDP